MVFHNIIIEQRDLFLSNPAYRALKKIIFI
nr:MAG TPA: hypothetical protein [Caudoviricetes sp.]